MFPNMVPSNNRRTLGHSYNNPSTSNQLRYRSANIVRSLAVAGTLLLLGRLRLCIYRVASSENQVHQTGGLRQELTPGKTGATAPQTEEAARVADKVRSLR
jgi:hypothetical protein